ncbi:hypothetical protein ACFL67_01310 [candidate division KSB1 bacterium]
MVHKKKYILAISLIYVVFYCCSGSIPGMQTQENDFGSIFDRNYTMPIKAEAFSEYEWNEESRSAFNKYLDILNNRYYQYDHENCITELYQLIEQYPYDARFYIRLSECLARSRDNIRARDILSSGSRFLAGFSNHPGVSHYISELDTSISTQLSRGNTASQPEGLWGKTKNILTWLPRKIKGLF